MSKLKEAINKTVEQLLTGTHDELFNDNDLSLVCDMTVDLLRKEIKDNADNDLWDCVIPFKFNGKDYHADYLQELTPDGDIIWVCQVIDAEVMHCYNTQFMWSEWAEDI